MQLHRLIPVIILLALCSALPIQSTSAELAPQAGASDELFQAYSDGYFFQRSVDFQWEMLRDEGLLTWLYQGINAEVLRRMQEDPGGTLEAVAPPELAGVSDTGYVLPADLDDAPTRVRYMAWEKLQRDEFNHKFYQARTIKDRLIAAANTQQRLRMFRWDLESAILAFRDGSYANAIARFSETIDHYGYSNLADLYFYRGESFFAVRLLDLARDDYIKVLDQDDPDYRLKADERLIVIAGDLGDQRGLDDYWRAYQTESGGATSHDYWRILELAARYYMTLQKWETARDLFNQIPETSERYGYARICSGDCSLALKDLDQADATYQQILQPTDKKAATRLTESRSEANLKLGYVNFLRSDFNAALDRLDEVGNGGELGEKAALVSAWCWYQLGAYQTARNNCTDLLKQYPETNYYYEANTLIGFCDEILGVPADSAAGYQVVMTSMDNRQDYHDINYEHQSVEQAISTLQGLEPLLFVEGEDEFWGQYLDLQRRLVLLSENVHLAVGVKANPRLQDVIAERGEVARLLKEQFNMGDEVIKSEDVKLSQEYGDLAILLSGLNDEIASGIRYYLSRKPLVQREEEQTFQRMMADSLITRLRREWDSSVRSLSSLRSLTESAANSGDTELLFALAGVEADLNLVKDEIVESRESLGDLSLPPVVSNLDWWSWFAYRRHGKDFVRFDDYYNRQNRLNELDSYIAAINNVLNDRRASRVEEAVLPQGLVPHSQPGEAPYVAPPAPMWHPPTPPAAATAPADTAGQVAPPDTGTTTQPSPEGTPGEVAPVPETQPDTQPEGQVSPEQPGSQPEGTPEQPPTDTPPKEGKGLLTGGELEQGDLRLSAVEISRKSCNETA
jgi:hypothetical protein